MDERHSRGSLSQEILDAVEIGRQHPVDLPHRDEEDLDRSLRPAVTLVSAWVSQLAHQQRIDTTLLATRADLVALLRGDAKARLAEGWRAEVLGDDVKRLVAGDAALSFDGRGGLRLIALRLSHRRRTAAADRNSRRVREMGPRPQDSRESRFATDVAERPGGGADPPIAPCNRIDSPTMSHR